MFRHNKCSNAAELQCVNYEAMSIKTWKQVGDVLKATEKFWPYN